MQDGEELVLPTPRGYGAQRCGSFRRSSFGSTGHGFAVALLVSIGCGAGHGFAGHGSALRS